MYLTKNSIDNRKAKVNIAFEKVVDDLLMVSTNRQVQSDVILSYWRLTKIVGIPPLEIGINCANGDLASITFYMDKSQIKETKRVDVHVDEGNVRIDTDIFTKINDYIDVEEEYEIYIQENELICMFGKSNEYKNSYQNERLKIFIDSQNQIIGFAICELLEDETKILSSL